MALTEKQKKFVESMRLHAERVAGELGISPDLIIAQSAVETGFGNHAPNNNYFGIKGKGVSLPTTEYRNGRMTPETASFRGYKDMADSVNGYGDFIRSNPRYAGLLQSGNDFMGNVNAIAKSGYATDPAYKNKLVSVRNLISGGGGVAANNGIVAENTNGSGARAGGTSAAPVIVDTEEIRKKQEENNPYGQGYVRDLVKSITTPVIYADIDKRTPTFDEIYARFS